SNVNDIAWRNSLTATRLVDLRASILDAEKVINEASLDKYSFVRNAWLQRRQNQVYDGNPPRLKRDDDGDE
ncbi:MlaA family lipoprotein, partial [Acinetobacter baumannii]